MRIVYTAAAVVAFGLASATAAHSEATPAPVATAAPYTLLEAGASSEQLSNGRGVWQSQYVLLARHIAAREAIYAGAANDARFGHADRRYLAGFYAPTSTNTFVNVEVDVSPSHVVLPQAEVFASLEHRLARGWGYAIGLRHRTYSSLGVDTATLTVDRYWKHDRAGYALNATLLSDVPGASLGGSVFFTRYYGTDDRNSATFSVQDGREAENDGAGVLVSNVVGASVGGVQWMGGPLAFVWSLSSLRQGALYTRTGGQLGLRYRL